MIFKHQILHLEISRGIFFKVVEEEDLDKVVDFYFDVFLKGGLGFLISILWWTIY